MMIVLYFMLCSEICEKKKQCLAANTGPHPLWRVCHIYIRSDLFKMMNNFEHMLLNYARLACMSCVLGKQATSKKKFPRTICEIWYTGNFLYEWGWLKQEIITCWWCVCATCFMLVRTWKRKAKMWESLLWLSIQIKQKHFFHTM